MARSRITTALAATAAVLVALAFVEVWTACAAAGGDVAESSGPTKARCSVNCADRETPEFEALLADYKRDGTYPGRGPAHVYLTLTLESVGGAVPDRLSNRCDDDYFNPVNTPDVSEEIWDRRKVLQFLKLWVSEQEELWGCQTTN